MIPAKRRRRTTCMSCGKPLTPRPGESFGKKCCSRACGDAVAGFRLRRQLLRRNRTKPERTLFRLVSAAYPDAVQERRFGRWVVDVYVPSAHLAFEADGTYWHRNSQNRDRQRDARLMDAFGLPVARLTERELTRMASGLAS